jgi:hypothetical protein
MRRPCRREAALLGLMLSLAGAAPANAAPGGVGVRLDRHRADLSLGDTFHFSSTLTNTGARATPDLVAHLNIVGLDPGIYVDPEDWSSRRTRYLGPLGRGHSATLRWSVKAVTGGSLAVYVVVLERRPDGSVAPAPIAPARPVAVHVTERRTLDSGGILPLVLGVPAIVGAIGIASGRMRRRRTSPGRVSSRST